MKIDWGMLVALVGGLAAGSAAVAGFGSASGAADHVLERPSTTPAPRRGVEAHDGSAAIALDAPSADPNVPEPPESNAQSPIRTLRPQDLMASDAPYSPLGSIGHPFTSRLQWMFIESNIDWSSRDLSLLQRSLTESLENARKSVAALPAYEVAVAPQPWASEKFQCFAFFGSRLDQPTAAHIVIAGRDFTEPASPEESLKWWEAELGPISAAARVAALGLLTDYERERRTLMFRAFSRVFEHRSAPQPERPICILVTDDRVILADSSRLPTLTLLDEEHRSLSAKHWNAAARSIGAYGEAK